MKRLNVWKPDLKTAAVNVSKSTKENLMYLQLPKALGLKELKEDVKTGAVQFKHLIKYAEGEPQYFTIIRAYGLEEGLNAVTYLASCYREKEKNGSEELPEEEPIESDEETNATDVETIALDEEVLWSDGRWKLSRDRIPVFGLEELDFNGNQAYRGFGFGRVFQRIEEQQTVYSIHEQTGFESVCYVSRHDHLYDHGFAVARSELKTYHKKNRHIFYISLIGRETLYESSAEIDAFTISNQEAYASLMLDFDGEVCTLNHDKLVLMKYYQLILSSAFSEMGLLVGKALNTEQILRQVESICFNDNGFAETLSRVLRYAAAMKKDNGPMCREDFEFLKSFTDILKQRAALSASGKSAKELQDNLVGMEKVKTQIRRYINIMKYNRFRRENRKQSTDFHNTFLFLGAPGTAKTTAAQLMGAIMSEEKLLSGRRFISVNGAELKGAFVGHTAPKVHRLFEENDIILIDEAYALTCTDGYGMDSYSKEAISQLIIEMEEHGSDKLIIFAGYGGSQVDRKDNKMKQFLESNPGIRSRINGTILFESYTIDQLVDIFCSMSTQQQICIPQCSLTEVRAYFEEIHKMPNFGNGREARKLLEQITLQAAIRMKDMDMKKLTKEDVMMYKPEDVTNAIRRLKESAEQQMGVNGFRSGFYQERQPV